jgi:hypothetical protein
MARDGEVPGDELARQATRSSPSTADPPSATA